MTTPRQPSEQDIERVRQQELARLQAELREGEAKAEMYKRAAQRLDEKIAESEKANKKSGCYIATACYGSYDHPDVLVLRRFRDDTLWPTVYGRLFIKAYYAISPSVAKRLGQVSWLSCFIRKWLLEPLVKKLR